MFNRYPNLAKATIKCPLGRGKIPEPKVMLLGSHYSRVVVICEVTV